MAQIKMGGGYLTSYYDRVDELSADVDRRFNIFNTAIASKYIEQDKRISNIQSNYNEIQSNVEKLQEAVKYNNWVNTLSWYKRFYYKVLNKDLKTIYKLSNEQDR